MKNAININCLFIRQHLLLLLLVFSSIAYSQQPGSIDLSFGHPVLEIGDSSRFNNTVYAVVVQHDDQKIIAAGSFTTYNGAQRPRIVRLLPDGNVDNSFVVPTGFSSGQVNTLALQANGQILAGGTFTSYNAQPLSRIVRINSNGSHDENFNVGTGFNNTVNTIVVQPDGKILVGGTFTSYNGVTCNRIVRLHSTGEIDDTFNTGSGFGGEVNSLAIDSNDRILVGGNYTVFNGLNNKNRIVRLNPNGTLDNNFTGTGCTGGAVNKIVVLPNGNIVLAGNFTNYNGAGNKWRIVKIGSDGVLVSGTNFNSINGFNYDVYDIALDQSTGDLLVGGEFTTYNGHPLNRICRLTENGDIDNTFLIGTGVHGNEVRSIAIQQDNKIICSGSFTEYQKTWRPRILRIHANGLLDNTLNRIWGFTNNNLSSPSVSTQKSIVVQPDGKILVGGDFSRYNGVNYFGLIRLHPNGDIDTTFKVQFASNNMVNVVKLDTLNQKIYIGGNFTSYNSQSRNRIARLNWDGTLDMTFSVQQGFNSTVHDIAIQPTDGKIVVGGEFSTYDNINRNRLARINSNGVLDVGFTVNNLANNSGGISGTVYTLDLQNDGYILVGGTFSQYNGVNRSNIARIDNTSVLDETFNVGLGGTVYDILVQPDGKIIVGGGVFGNFNSRIVRLNTNGTLDQEFHANAGTGSYIGTIRAIAIDSDNRITIGGRWSLPGTGGDGRIMRLNDNGTTDSAFNPGTGFNNTVHSIALHQDSAVLVGGIFSICQNYFIYGMARLNAESGCTSEMLPSVPAITGENELCQNEQTIYSASAQNATAYDWSYPSGWNATASGTNITLTATTSGVYSISVTASNACGESETQTIAITVNPIVTPTISINGTIEAGAGEEVSLTATIGNYTGDNYTIVWYVNGVEVETTDTPNFTYNKEGNGNDIVTAVFHPETMCHNNATSDSHTVTGISNVHEETLGNTRIYPNPARSVINIVLSTSDTYEISIYNSVGTLVNHSQMNGTNHTLNIDHLSSGMYIIKIKNTDGLTSERMLMVE